MGTDEDRREDAAFLDAFHGLPHRIIIPMEHFGCRKTLVSDPACVKRRGRLLPEALETIFRLFVENTRPSNRYKGLQLLAVDGSDLHTPTNPDDTASFIPGSGPYNLQHLNALYDLCSHIYMDAIVQGRHQYDERRVLCDMVDRANAAYPAIIIADRGYESYNVFAHIQEKGWKFLIRVKDRNSNGIVNGLELPAQDEFDVPIRLALSRTVAFETLDNLMTILKTAEISSASKRRLKFLHKATLVVVNEVGVMPLSPSEANLFFGFISAMSEKPPSSRGRSFAAMRAETDTTRQKDTMEYR